jgi:3-dehydroshikimate dehydratase
MLFRPGLVSVTFRSLAPKDIIQLAVETRLEGIEWGGDIHVPPGDLANAREVARATREAGLEVAAYGSYYRAGESEKSGLRFAQVCETAAVLQAPTIRIWAGTGNSADVTPAYRELVVEDINRVAAMAAEAGMSVSLEFHVKTLTDTVESTLELLKVTPPDRVRSYWQPPVGQEPDVALEGLQRILPRLSNVHVFHWWPDSRTRLPLEDGREIWKRYLELAQSPNRNGWAMLEFVKNDDPEQLKRDARTLHEILGRA